MLIPLTTTAPASADQPTPRPSAAPAQALAAPERGPVPAAPDPGFVTQCENDAEARTKEGRVFNRGVWCQNIGRVMRTSRGTVTVHFTALAYADATDRRVRVFFRVNDYETTGLYTGLTNLKMRVICEFDCTTTGDDDSAKDNWLATWRGAEWVSWDLTSPDMGEGDDHVLRHKWNFLANIGRNNLKPGVDFAMLQHRVRCDSAAYFRSARACVNDDVIPFLTYKRSELPELTEHISRAQNAPSETFPNRGTPKKIPGKYTGRWGDPGLHRVPYQGEVWKANKLELERIKHGRAPYGKPNDLRPKPTDKSYDLDEYPMASTQEGLADKAGGEQLTGNSSVDWVDSGQNQAGGRLLKDFYARDRILYGQHDEFYVHIAP
ncbi:NucA/NucB deoxyribonuclease domain-containing protein [Streptomyces sp. 8N706]|uniref:NucA/NucB deoxyribonuclease domain-containing protein n=1 Tax=Streptomyces sp. 8N706 TaxID=3457416 RepID=UPI003FD39249